jgi:hypothetical protein
MGVGSYLRLKGRASVFRRKVPDALRARLARTEICATLGIVSRDSAERGARQLAVAVDAFFSSAMRNMNLSSTDLSGVIASAIQTWRENDERHDARFVLANGRAIGTPREDALLLAEMAEMALAAHGTGRSLYDAGFVQSRFAAAGIEPPSELPDLHRAGRSLTLGLSSYYLAAAIALADRHDLGRGLRGLPVERWRAHHERLLHQLGLGEAQVRIANPRAATPAVPAAPPVQVSQTGLEVARTPEEALSGGPLFVEVIAESLERRIATRELAKSALQDAQSSIRIWVEVVGNRPVSAYKRADVSRFQEVLTRLPKHYWRSAAEREKPILQVIAEAEARNKNYQRVQNTTVNKHLCVIAPFFEWAVKHEKMPETDKPFWNGFMLPTGAAVTGLEVNEERPGWPDDQIAKLFRHPVYTGRRSAYFYNDAGNVIVRDGLYWTPIIAGLHGMRREEFSQLRVRHVRQVEGIWVFDLHAADIDLKTSWSRRYVPLHRDLFALGFLEEMVTGRKPDEMLFAGVARSTANDVYGDGIGKRVARMMDSVGMEVVRKDGTESDGVYHPFRHRLRTMLVNLNVNEAIIDSITGHSPKKRGGQQARYTDAVHVPVLKKFVDQVTLPYDIKVMNAAWEKRETTAS